MQMTERTRYSDEELEEFRVLIQAKIAEAKEQLDFYLQQLRDVSSSADGKIRGLDDGTGTTEMEEIQGNAVRQQKLIRHLENALIRIDNKVYGICRETGRLIPKERLLLVPHATLSVDAKKGR